jgi:hypothetical protein
MEELASLYQGEAKKNHKPEDKNRNRRAYRGANEK